MRVATATGPLWVDPREHERRGWRWAAAGAEAVERQAASA